MFTDHRRRRGVLAAAAASALVVALASPASAAPAKRIVDDPVEPNKGYDIVKVAIHSQKTEATNARVVVTHGREVDTGDAIDVWFDLDADAIPDIHIVGDSFSEYSVFRAKSFAEDGKDISNKGCMSLEMKESKSVVRFKPACLGAGPTYAVSVKSSRTFQPAGGPDYLPARRTFTKKVLSGPLA